MSGFDAVNTHVPVTVGVILNQSLSPDTSIVPLTGVDRLDQVQYDDVDDPQSSATGAGCDTDTEADAVPTVVANTAEPLRADAAVFAAAVNVTGVVPALPDDGVAAIHPGNVACHDVFDVTVTLVAAPAAGVTHDVGDTEITGATVTPELVALTDEHPDFTAVARTVTGTPTSAVTNVYVFAVAPEIAVPFRNH